MSPCLGLLDGMRSHVKTGLLVLAITLPTGGFAGFTVIEYFQDAFDLPEILRALRGQVNHVCLPAVRRGD